MQKNTKQYFNLITALLALLKSIDIVGIKTFYSQIECTIY